MSKCIAIRCCNLLQNLPRNIFFRQYYPSLQINILIGIYNCLVSIVKYILKILSRYYINRYTLFVSKRIRIYNYLLIILLSVMFYLTSTVDLFVSILAFGVLYGS